MIDSHQHFWKIDKGFYKWLTPDLKAIYKDFLPNDLKSVLDEHGVKKSILVQAANSVDETYYMYKLSQECDFIGGIVGWVDMEDSSSIQTLNHFKELSIIKGIRPMIQDIEDDEWMLKTSLKPVIDELIKLDMSFDALIKPYHIQHLKQFLKKYEGLKVVIDHGAKPYIRNGFDGKFGFKEWSRLIKSLSEFNNLYCKVSGFMSEASDDTNSDIGAYIKHLLECFGDKRLMWGSDWPVLNLSSSYGKWLDICSSVFKGLSADERCSIFNDNAKDFYSI